MSRTSQSVGSSTSGPRTTTAERAGGAVGTRAEELVSRVRAICLALPGVEERRSHGTPGFFAGRQFLHVWPDGHHDRVFPQLWCAAPPGAQEELTDLEPERFFRPPYVGPRGWVGLRLDGKVDWAEVTELCGQAHRTVTQRRAT